jgi:hypothetical protein
MLIPRTLILSDGSVPSLLACVAIREELASSESASAGGGGGGVARGTSTQGPTPVVVPFPFRSFGDPARLSRIAEQASFLALEFVAEPPVTVEGLEVDGGEREAHELIAAGYLAASLGCERVVWPVSAGLGEALNVERIAEIADRALLASKLVALDRAVKCPAFNIVTPYVDYTDVQIAECALDLDVPVDDVWWHSVAGDEAEADRRRWGPALRSAGYRVAAA